MKDGQGTGIFRGYGRAWARRLSCPSMGMLMQGPLLERVM